MIKPLYPAIEPYVSYHLPVDNGHRIYVEECGNPTGIPVIFLHGGPASGCRPEHRSFFNPQYYRIILFDQRGCGRSLPYGDLRNNTTQDLINDMERIRLHIDVDQWLLFGGSWGGALALLYAQRHPGKVTGMIIRCVFLARKSDLEWFIQSGANRIYPEQWEKLISSIPVAKQGEQKLAQLIEAINRQLHDTDSQTQCRIARAWDNWSSQIALGNNYHPAETDEPVSDTLIQRIMIELHYARHRYFIEENQIIQHCDRLDDIPAIILHGRNDLLCPIEAGFCLSRALPNATFSILPRSGHIAQGEEMISALVNATERMRVI